MIVRLGSCCAGHQHIADEYRIYLVRVPIRISLVKGHYYQGSRREFGNRVRTKKHFQEFRNIYNVRVAVNISRVANKLSWFEVMAIIQ